MKKIILAFSLIFVFAVYAFYQRVEGLNYAYVAPNDKQFVVSKIQPPKIISDLYKNGEYVGNIADAYYGNVQVKAIIKGGKIADVRFLDYPQDRHTSIEINTQAMPQLKTEAVQIQDAQVDIISGATQTSRAFRESLAAALTQAKN